MFLGSKKYPAENAYDGFLAKRGGSSNAHTDVEHTSYYFDVLPGAFREALDIFAQFFVSPSFNPDMVAREVNAIDNEFNETRRDDAARLDELLYVAGAPGGPPLRHLHLGPRGVAAPRRRERRRRRQGVVSRPLPRVEHEALPRGAGGARRDGGLVPREL